jgi:hypothetical protein
MEEDAGRKSPATTTMRDTQARRNSSDSRRPKRRSQGPPSGPPPPAHDGDAPGLEELYDELFGTPLLQAPPSPLEAFCMVYTLVRKHPEYAGTARAAVQAAENAVMTETDVAARGGEGR